MFKDIVYGLAPMLVAAQFTVSKIWDQPRSPPTNA